MPKSATNKNVFKNFFLPMIVLVAICVVIGSAMAAVNMITAPKIAETHAKKEQEALSVVVPNNQGFDQVELDKAYDSVVALYADKGSDALAVMLSVKGYDSSNPMSVAVGFDEDGGRIGHGAGYYDRYIDRAPDACRVCIAFEAQRLEQVVEEDTDMPMDYVVTEANIYKF